MKLKLLYLFIYIGTVFAFSACSDNLEVPDDSDTYESVAIVYWMGDNSLSSYAEKDIEELVGCQVNLQLFVKVRRDWRDDKTQLKSFGYDIKSLGS